MCLSLRSPTTSLDRILLFISIHHFSKWTISLYFGPHYFVYTKVSFLLITPNWGSIFFKITYSFLHEILDSPAPLAFWFFLLKQTAKFIQITLKYQSWFDSIIQAHLFEKLKVTTTQARKKSVMPPIMNCAVVCPRFVVLPHNYISFEPSPDDNVMSKRHLIILQTLESLSHRSI